MKRAKFIRIALTLAFFFIFITALLLILNDKFHLIDFFKKKVAITYVVKHFPFLKENSLKEWEEKILKGRVVYAIEKDEDLSYVRAKSQKAASALFYKINLNIENRPFVSWKWRVGEFPARNLPECIEDKNEEDFAARVYVIFPAAFFTKSKAIEYIWSETLPAGTCGTSGYSKNIKALVLEKGKTDDWRFEKRNIYEDYVKLFGKEPRLDIGAIAFMTDADSTCTTSDAVYDEIEVGYNAN